MNLSNAEQGFKIPDEEINGDPTNIFTSKKEKITNTQSIKLTAWDYKVYVY